MKKGLIIFLLLFPGLLLAGKSGFPASPAPDTGKLIRYNPADTLLKVPAQWKEISRTFPGKTKTIIPARYLLQTTGKNNGLQTARWIAAGMKRNILQVNLAGFISKYIGETEKNLARVFDHAEEAGLILFFDEADALFGKRTNPSESNDRYANQEVAYLVQRIEKYAGVVLIACSGEDCLKNLKIKNCKPISW